MGYAALITLAVYGVIDIIVMLFFNGAIYIAEAIMSESIITFSDGENIITKFTSLIPFSNNIMSIVEGFAYGIMILAIVVSVMKTITAPVTGEPADNPINILGRVVFAIITKYAIFGSESSGLLRATSAGLLGTIGRWFGTMLGAINAPADIETNYMSAWGCSPYAYIGYLILAAALIGSVITAAVSYIERIIAFGLSIVVGPVAISMMASRETSSIAKEWIMSIFTQFGAILLNLALWGAFANKLSTLTGQFGEELTGQLILDIAIAIAILSMIKNCEQIFNSFGLRTIPNSDTAKSIVGGIASVGSGATMAIRSIPQIREGFGSLTHGSQPVIGGTSGGGHRSGAGSFGTGMASFYDKNGKMAGGSSFKDAVKNGDIGGIGNAARRGFANAMTAGVIAPQQDRQMAALGNIGKAINEATPGQRYGGFVETSKSGAIKTDKNNKPIYHTGVETANMAIGGGKKEGAGIRFQSSASGAMGEAVSPGVLNAQGHTPNGIYSGAAGKNPSDSLLVGSAVSPSGQEVKGFVGNAAKVNSDGTTTPMGNVFIPTSGANEPLAIGSRINIGGEDGEGLQIKSAFNVDESGHLGYTTEPFIPGGKVADDYRQGWIDQKAGVGPSTAADFANQSAAYRSGFADSQNEAMYGSSAPDGFNHSTPVYSTDSEADYHRGWEDENYGIPAPGKVNSNSDAYYNARYDAEDGRPYGYSLDPKNIYRRDGDSAASVDGENAFASGVGASVGAGESFVGDKKPDFRDFGEFGAHLNDIFYGDSSGGGQIFGAENMVGENDYDPTAYHQPPDAPVGTYDYGNHPERYDNPENYSSGGTTETPSPFTGAAEEVPAQNREQEAAPQVAPEVVPISEFYDDNLFPQHAAVDNREAVYNGASSFAGDGYMPDINIPEAPSYEQQSGGYEVVKPQMEITEAPQQESASHVQNTGNLEQTSTATTQEGNTYISQTKKNSAEQKADAEGFDLFAEEPEQQEQRPKKRRRRRHNNS